MNVTTDCTTKIESTRITIEVEKGKAFFTRIPCTGVKNALTADDLVDASDAFLAAAEALQGGRERLPSGFFVGQKIRNTNTGTIGTVVRAADDRENLLDQAGRVHYRVLRGGFVPVGNTSRDDKRWIEVA